MYKIQIWMKFAKANVSLSSVNHLFGVIVAVIFILGNICNNQLIIAIRKETRIFPCGELYEGGPERKIAYFMLAVGKIVIFVFYHDWSEKWYRLWRHTLT